MCYGLIDYSLRSSIAHHHAYQPSHSSFICGAFRAVLRRAQRSYLALEAQPADRDRRFRQRNDASRHARSLEFCGVCSPKPAADPVCRVARRASVVGPRTMRLPFGWENISRPWRQPAQRGLPSPRPSTCCCPCNPVASYRVARPRATAVPGAYSTQKPMKRSLHTGTPTRWSEKGKAVKQAFTPEGAEN